jgi:hypothetical protein
MATWLLRAGVDPTPMATSIEARHREIARRYKAKSRERPVSMAALRIAELRRLFKARYGDTLPDDDAGRDEVFVMANHLARRPGDQRQRIASWCEMQAPWMRGDELEDMITKVLANPLRWRADALAARLNLNLAERTRLRITTIGAVDRTAAQRREDRRERRRLAEQARRRAAREERGQHNTDHMPATADGTLPLASTRRRVSSMKRKLVPQMVGKVDKRRRPRGLTRAIRTAIDAIIFDRCTRAEACKKAAITERALYLALEKIEVAAYWRRQTDVLRTGERAANLHALVRVRDSERNAAASVKAVQVLEQLSDEAGSRPVGVPMQPGLVIVVTNAPAHLQASPAPVAIDAKREREPAV